MPGATRLKSSPRPSRGWALTSPPWARAIARTIDNLSPKPWLRVRSSRSRRNGSNRPGVLYGGTTGPVFSTTSRPAGTATLVIGGVAGLYPAIRASRLSPTEALATP